MILQPLAEWSSGSCQCGLTEARTVGAAFGTIIGLGFSIVGSILDLIWDALLSAIGLVTFIIGIGREDATVPSITCDDGAFLFCWALAGVMLIDDVGGGIVTAFVLLMLSIFTIYVALYIIRNVREMMQPGSGGDV